MIASCARPGWQRWVPALLLLPVVALAQAPSPTARTERPDPLDAQARVPPTAYQSPLAGYRRLGEDLRVPWKEANETVNRIGGWRTYAREAQQPEAAASSPAGSVPAHGSAPGQASQPRR